MSIGGVITLGLGSWGSTSEVITLGYSSGEAAAIIVGACVRAGMVYLPGAKAGQAYLPGARVGSVYLPGGKAGGDCC
jgi:hypothetical protein